jgi:polysaccharide pyruvyl transferase CsaB
VADRQRADGRRGARHPGRRGAALDHPTDQPVLISGYYGFGNLGDEAVLAGLLVGLREHAPGARPVVLSANPAATRAMHQVDAVPRAPADVWRALSDARLLVSGGGSLVQDVTSARSALYYLGTMQAASWRSVPIAVIGQGIGPVERPWVRSLAGRAYSKAQIVSVRDADSVNTLNALGVTRHVHLGADLALLAPAADASSVRDRIGAEGLDRARVRVGVAIRSWPGMRDLEELGRGVGRFAEMFGARVAVFPFDLVRDRQASRIVADAAVGRVLEATTPSELLGLVGAMDLMVAVRLHGLIFAAAGGVPSVALAYDPKVRAFMSEIGMPAVLPVDSTGLAVAEAMARTWDGQIALRSRVRAAVPALRARASAAIGLVARYLGAPAGTGAGVLPD